MINYCKFRSREIKRDLSGIEFKILYHLVDGCSYAKSLGKDYFENSYTQIREENGIKTDNTVNKVLKSLKEKGLINYKSDWSDKFNRQERTVFTVREDLLYEEGNDSTVKNKVGSTVKNKVGSTVKNVEIYNNDIINKYNKEGKRENSLDGVKKKDNTDSEFKLEF